MTYLSLLQGNNSWNLRFICGCNDIIYIYVKTKLTVGCICMCWNIGVRSIQNLIVLLSTKWRIIHKNRRNRIHFYEK